MLQRREKLVVLLSVNFTESGWIEMTIMLYELRFKAFVVVFEKPRYCKCNGIDENTRSSTPNYERQWVASFFQQTCSFCHWHCVDVLNMFISGAHLGRRHSVIF